MEDRTTEMKTDSSELTVVEVRRANNNYTLVESEQDINEEEVDEQ